MDDPIVGYTLWLGLTAAMMAPIFLGFSLFANNEDEKTSKMHDRLLLLARQGGVLAIVLVLFALIFVLGALITRPTPRPQATDPCPRCLASVNERQTEIVNRLERIERLSASRPGGDQDPLHRDPVIIIDRRDDLHQTLADPPILETHRGWYFVGAILAISFGFYFWFGGPGLLTLYRHLKKRMS